MITSSARKASQTIQLSALARIAMVPVSWVSESATAGRVSAAAIIIGVLRRAATRSLRASMAP